MPTPLRVHRATWSLPGVLAMTLLAACPRPGQPGAETGIVPDSVSVGYGRVSRAHATTASAIVSGDDPTAAHAVSIEEMIAGRVPGVEVTRAGAGGYSIRIRGVNRLSAGGGEPLIIVDGSPATYHGSGGGLTGVVPSDVQRIEVLKDPASLAIYGSRGANGVILITTRHGS